MQCFEPGSSAQEVLKWGPTEGGAGGPPDRGLIREGSKVSVHDSGLRPTAREVLKWGPCGEALESRHGGGRQRREQGVEHKFEPRLIRWRGVQMGVYRGGWRPAYQGVQRE